MDERREEAESGAARSDGMDGLAGLTGMDGGTGMPLVSVVMNCLDGEAHLAEAIQSVMAQTFQDFEIVFWDNCSTDSSPDIARSFGEKLRYFRGSAKVSLGAGRNLAITRARGKYIAFLYCDDRWAPEKLEKQVAKFEANPRVGIVTTDTELFDGKKILRRFFDGARPARGMVFEELVRRQWISMSSAMVRREALRGLTGDGAWAGGWFDESLGLCEEADVFYRIAHDWELDYVDEPLTGWRVHASSTTFTRFAGFAAETRHILAKFMALYPDFEKEHADLARLLGERADFQEALALWREGRGREARALMAPHGLKNRKYLAFRLASHLPGSFFDLAARVYFALPRLFSNR